MKRKPQQVGPLVKVRRLVKHGSSFYIVVPKPFVKLHGLRAGERVPIICDHVMKIVPMKEEG